MKKNIYINGRFLTQPKTGVQRYAEELLTATDQLVERSEYSHYQFVCLVPKDPHQLRTPDWRNIQVKACGKLKGNLWEQIDLPFYSCDGLLVDLCNIGPVLHPAQIVIIHDASVFAIPEAYSFPFRLKYKFIFFWLSRTALQILTDSQFSRSEVAHYLHLSAEKMIVLYGGSEHILKVPPDDSILTKHSLEKGNYFLAVGSNSRHKNMKAVISAVEESPEELPVLAIAGGTYSKVFQGEEEITSRKIKRLGYVSDSELRALYDHALAFIFPSLYEGFGLPPLEAMSCGCPVISSNRASLPEVCGNAAIYFDPTNPEELSSCLVEVADSAELRAKMVRIGLAQAKQFTWEKAAAEFLSLLMEEDKNRCSD